MYIVCTIGDMARRNSVAISAARENLAALVKKAGRGQPVEITQDGKPAAVLVSVDDARRIEAATGYWQWLEEYGGVDLSSLETEDERRWADDAARKVRAKR